MDYKDFYTISQTDPSNFFDEGTGIYEGLFMMDGKQKNFSSYQNIDEDEEFQEFKKNIEFGAKRLKESFQLCNLDLILESLKYFKKSEFYYRSGFEELFKLNETCKILIDLIDIDQKTNPTDIQTEITELAFFSMYSITSVDSDYATNELFKLKLLDIFFKKMNYYSDFAFYYGLNTISNIIPHLNTSNDENDFILKPYFYRILQFIEVDNFQKINNGRDSKVLDAEFKLIFALILSFPRSSNLKEIVKQKADAVFKENRKENIDEKSIEIDFFARKIEYTYELAREIAYKIIIFLALNNHMLDSREETYLFKALYVICDKYQEIFILNSSNQELSPYLIQMLNILDSNNQESIEASIDLFRILQKVNNIKALRLFHWNSILDRISQRPKWIASFLSLVKKSTDSFDSFNFLWSNNVYQQLIIKFNSFSYEMRIEICSIFILLTEKIPSELCVEYLVNNGIYFIFFSLLQNDNDDVIGQILRALIILNSKAENASQMDIVVSQYKEYDAYSIFETLPPFFSNELTQIFEATEPYYFT